MEEALATKRVLAEDDRRHGTENAYNHFACRCERCSKAHSRYMKRYRQKVAARKAARALPLTVISEIAKFMDAEPRLKNEHWYWSERGSSPVIAALVEDGQAYKRVEYPVRDVLYLLGRETVVGQSDRIGATCSGTTRCVNPHHAKILRFHPEALSALGYPQQVVTRLMLFVRHSAFTECWNWRMPRLQVEPSPVVTGKTVTEEGPTEGPSFDAREAVYALWKGKPLPEGNRIEMSCGKGGCLNPRHMTFVNPNKEALTKPSHADDNTSPSVPDISQVASTPKPGSEPAAGKPTRAQRKLKAKKIQEFVRTVREELNASVDYAVCLSDKIVYNNEDDAKRAVEIWRNLEIAGEAAMRDYHCPQCGYWHLSSIDKWEVKPSMIRGMLRGTTHRSRR